MIPLRTTRYMRQDWYLCPAVGCSCLMRATDADYRARNPEGPTHVCADWDCWGRAWVGEDGACTRVQAEPPDEEARRRRAFRLD